MIKPVLNINDLLIFIKNNKKITFTNLSEEENMKNLLHTYNYLNIFSLKYFLQQEQSLIKILKELFIVILALLNISI